MTAYGYVNTGHPGLSSPMRRMWILFSILILHFAIIGGPLFWNWAHGKLSPPKENRFKVKLGEITPSHAPEVGPPERTRPRPTPPAAAPAPAEPKIAPRPKPKPKPRPAEPKIVPRPKPKPKSRPKPRPAEPKIAPRPRPVEPKVVPRPVRDANSRSAAQNRRQNRRQNIEDQVYQAPGGNNFNPNVRIGSRDTGQVRGPADHKTPQGGLTQADEAYYNNLKRFLDFRWVEPPRSLLGGQRPTAVLELTIAADGRVLGAKLSESSGNAMMEASIRRLIKVLDRVPAPPNGQLTILVDMEIK